MAEDPVGPEPAILPGTSFDLARRQAAALLAGVSGGEAALDARIMLEEASGLDRATLLRDGTASLGEAAAIRLAALLRRRLDGEPLWRVLGRREFWGLTFEITPAVLDPRPDTETVVSAALERLGTRRRGSPLSILDLGTGSGALLCALCRECAFATGWGVDRSLAACRVAARNVAALGLAGRAVVVNGDWTSAMPDGMFDVVVSNPPYIETGSIPSLSREVRAFDPLTALDGGADGFDAYRAIAADLARVLAPDGFAVFEVGATQATAVGQLLAGRGLAVSSVHRDLGGHERALVAGHARGSAGDADTQSICVRAAHDLARPDEPGTRPR